MLMNESFILKFYGRFSLFEQINMTAEERAWFIRRIEKENKASSSTQPSIPAQR